MVYPSKVDVRLSGKGDSNSHGVRPDHLIISMIKWIRDRMLSIKNSLSLGLRVYPSLGQTREPRTAGKASTHNERGALARRMASIGRALWIGMP